MTQHGVILFHTTSSAIRAEKLLVKAGYAAKLIPTPREFSSDCGIALRFNWTQQQQVISVLAEAHVETDTVHQM
jgi:hypothetical protein